MRASAESLIVANVGFTMAGASDRVPSRSTTLTGKLSGEKLRSS